MGQEKLSNNVEELQAEVKKLRREIRAWRDLTDRRAMYCYNCASYVRNTCSTFMNPRDEHDICPQWTAKSSPGTASLAALLALTAGTR